MHSRPTSVKSLRRNCTPRGGGLLMAGGLMMLLGCHRAAAPTAEVITLVVSGDTAGWIVPCGCTSNQSGGLARRGAFVKSLQDKGDLILVDAGGAASGTAPYDVEKFRAILEGEAVMGIAAHNLGLSEARLGADVLHELATATGVTFVSCNVHDAAGAQIAKPWIVQQAGGQRLLIVGVLSDKTRVERLRIEPPHAAIIAALADAHGQYDHALVLAYMDEEQLLALAESLPEVDAIVGGPTGQSVSPRHVGPTLVASATNKGKFVATFTIPPAGAGNRWEGEIVEMNDSVSEDEQQRQNLAQFYEVLAQRDFAPSQTSFAPSLPATAPADFRIAGTQACRDCHTAECQAWDASRHAHAWQSLTATGAHVDAYCQQCHTTGYGLPGGFTTVAQSTARTAVGCESCHGPSTAHAREPKMPTAFAGQAGQQCAQCHDRENSPAFTYDTYWPRVRHGEEPATADNP